MNEMKYTLEERVARARELRAQGYNCAQCVAMAFDDVTGADNAVMARVAGGFGTGMGASGGVCGAVSGTTMVLGLVNDSDPRPELYCKVRESIQEFENLEGYLNCRDLKREGRKPCLELITDAVAMLHKRIENA